MHRPPDPLGSGWRRATIAVLLAVGVLVMAGPPASAAAPAGHEMASMTSMAGASAVDVLLPTGTAPDGAAMTGCAQPCGGLLEACLATLTLLAAAAVVLPALRCRVGAARRTVPTGRDGWSMGESPPWSVPSLSQLSVLRV